MRSDNIEGGKSMKKILLSLVIIMGVALLSACGKEETLDGKWVLTREELADGRVLKGKDIKIYESYEINGDTAKFMSIVDGLGETNIDLTVEQIGDNEYQFMIKNRLPFTTGKLEGKYLKCTVGEGSDATIFIYEKE